MENKTKNTVKEKVIKLDEQMMIEVKSNVFGELIYVNRRTGEETHWSQAGDVQTMSLADLRTMKATQVAFFSNQWIVIGSAEDEEVKPEDIYKALGVAKYYEDIIEPSNFNQINSWTLAQIPDKIAKLSNAAKLNLITALNDYIEEGKLDSVKKIKAFEQALGCELTQSN